ncbi:hypothetical protein, partial [Enterobacter hormaechei]
FTACRVGWGWGIFSALSSGGGGRPPTPPTKPHPHTPLVVAWVLAKSKYKNPPLNAKKLLKQKNYLIPIPYNLPFPASYPYH